MDKAGKASLAMVKPGQLEAGGDLALGVDKKEVERVEKLLVDYGAVVPQVAVKSSDKNFYKLIFNLSMVEALKNIKISEFPIIVASTKDATDEKLLALRLSLLGRGPGALAQGEMLKSLVGEGGYSLGQLSKELGMSKPWLSKRVSL